MGRYDLPKSLIIILPYLCYTVKNFLSFEAKKQDISCILSLKKDVAYRDIFYFLKLCDNLDLNKCSLGESLCRNAAAGGL